MMRTMVTKIDGTCNVPRTILRTGNLPCASVMYVFRNTYITRDSKMILSVRPSFYRFVCYACARQSSFDTGDTLYGDILNQGFS